VLEPDEMSLHREVRLRALREAPNSFGGTFEEEGSRSDAYWEAQTKAVTEPGRNVLFLACESREVYGMVYGLLDRERPDGARVGGMWVEPAMRRRGLGRDLLTSVIDWARGRKLKRIGLWAPAHGVAAIALYRTAGFHETPRRGRLRDGSEFEIVEMARDL